MDPDANLAEQLRLTEEINRITDACTDEGEFTPLQLDQLQHLAARLAELVEALNGWIAGGGFLPQAWRRGRS